MTTTLHSEEPGTVPDRSALLTDTQIRALAEIASGATLDLAAGRLGFSTRTLRRHVRSACDRLDVDTPIEAVVWAVKRGLI